MIEDDATRLRFIDDNKANEIVNAILGAIRNGWFCAVAFRTTATVLARANKYDQIERLVRYLVASLH